ncbi:MerR family transcriptional regulator [Streptomyces rochei]|uniref:MerR family transcriptional regulator n=1 Tax=Streptomyces TaxID=1883 RepID=UPI000782F4E3|nr:MULTISPECIES: MerR family transcriptional regulator [Streptomyces]KYK14266.1 hypothetical protein AUW26_28245 [Streptomyces sp. CC71]
MARPDDQHQTDGRMAGDQAEGGLWFTIAQAAAFTGRNRQTIYAWERRGLLANPRHDEHGRRIYSQQQIAEAHKKARENAAAAQGAA